jgi:hypothetical protein
MNQTLQVIRSVLKSQYYASLAMLRDAIAHCPPQEWLSTSVTKLRFRLWEKHHGGGDGTEAEPYKQAEALELEHQFVNIRHIQHHGGNGSTASARPPTSGFLGLRRAKRAPPPCPPSPLRTTL